MAWWPPFLAASTSASPDSPGFLPGVHRLFRIRCKDDFMFDVLVFLFENYFESNIHPDLDTLEKELSAAGFESNEISRAFDWLNGLETLAEFPYPGSLSASRSTRCYAAEETAKISLESRGFLVFLESSGVINPSQREWIIDRVMALDGPSVSLEQVKWTVLMVLWKQGKVDETLFLEDILLDEGEVSLH
jgi:Smg protein